MPDRQPFAAAKERRGIERTEPTFSTSSSSVLLKVAGRSPLSSPSPHSSSNLFSSFHLYKLLPPLHPTVGQALTHLPSSPSPHLFVPALLPPAQPLSPHLARERRGEQREGGPQVFANGTRREREAADNNCNTDDILPAADRLLHTIVGSPRPAVLLPPFCFMLGSPSWEIITGGRERGLEAEKKDRRQHNENDSHEICVSDCRWSSITRVALIQHSGMRKGRGSLRCSRWRCRTTSTFATSPSSSSWRSCWTRARTGGGRYTTSAASSAQRDSARR